MIKPTKYGWMLIAFVIGSLVLGGFPEGLLYIFAFCMGIIANVMLTTTGDPYEMGRMTGDWLKKHVVGEDYV